MLYIKSPSNKTNQTTTNKKTPPTNKPQRKSNNDSTLLICHQVSVYYYPGKLFSHSENPGHWLMEIDSTKNPTQPLHLYLVTAQESKTLRKLKTRFIFASQGRQVLPHYSSFRIARKNKCVIYESTLSVYYKEDTHQTSNSFKLDSSERLKAITCFTLSASSSPTLAHQWRKKKKEVEKWLTETAARFSVEILKWLTRKSQASL